MTGPARSSGSYNTRSLNSICYSPGSFTGILRNGGTKNPNPDPDHRPTPEALVLYKAIEILASVK